jgi:hypothetical protein
VWPARGYLALFDAVDLRGRRPRKMSIRTDGDAARETSA